jgi:RecJ-like exonuclease
MLKLTKLTAVLALTAVAGGAVAQEADPNIDVNGDGFYSFPEVSTIYTDVTYETFTAMYTTGAGLMDMAYVMAAQEAGLMPMAE